MVLKELMKRHSNDLHNPQSCTICGKGFPGFAGRIRHERAMHAKICKIVCNICNKQVNNRNAYYDHMKAAHNYKKNAVEKKGKMSFSSVSVYPYFRKQVEVKPKAEGI